MKEKTLSERNALIKQEFSNEVYNAISEGILTTAKKHNYKKYDIAKLIMAIYDKDFEYLTNTDDYREQIKLLDEYFVKTYDHRLITFEMIKAIKAFQGTDDYNNITSDIATLESIVRHNKNVPPENIEVFRKPLDEEAYDELMTKIENEKSFQYSLAVIYEKIKNKIM